MKQTIGYMEYDIRSIQGSLFFLIALFSIVSLAFVRQGSLMLITYMLFAGVVTDSAFFGTGKQGTVSFQSILPGTALQRVQGRFLSGFLVLFYCMAYGTLACFVLKTLGYDAAGVDAPMLAFMAGVVLAVVAFQNVLFYLLLPRLGVQFAGVIRMIPAFVMFFLMGKVVEHTDAEELAETLSGLPGWIENYSMAVLAAGIASWFLAIFLSWLIVRRKDNA